MRTTPSEATTPTPTRTPDDPGTGFRRVTVVTPDTRVDLALPEDLPLADLQPEVLRLATPASPPVGPVGHHLARLDGTVLDPALSLAAQCVLDGELLALRPFAASLPGPVFDDVPDAVATAVRADRTRWDDGLSRAVALTGSAAALLLAALTLWWAAPRGHGAHGLPAVLAAATGTLALAVAATRAVVHRDRGRGPASVLGAAALPHLLLAGSGLLPPHPGEGPGRLHLLLGCVTILVAAAVLLAVTPGPDAAFTAAAVCSGVCTVLVFTALVADLRPSGAAALGLAVAVCLLGFLPALAARLARLSPDTGTAPGADGPVDPDAVASRTRAAGELLTGLVAGCAATALGAAAVLALSGGTWDRLLVLTSGLALVLRARLLRHTAQVAAVLTAGGGALVLLVAVVAAGAAPAGSPAVTVWLPAALAVVALVLALRPPRAGGSPLGARAVEVVEAVLLFALFPLVLAVLGVYPAVRAMTG